MALAGWWTTLAFSPGQDNYKTVLACDRCENRIEIYTLRTMHNYDRLCSGSFVCGCKDCGGHVFHRLDIER